ncbi:MAG: hypothetical protein Q9182_001421 [Xanthomendoza sp. 2 TL-2023]
MYDDVYALPSRNDGRRYAISHGPDSGFHQFFRRDFPFFLALNFRFFYFLANSLEQNLETWIRRPRLGNATHESVLCPGSGCCGCSTVHPDITQSKLNPSDKVPKVSERLDNRSAHRHFRPAENDSSSMPNPYPMPDSPYALWFDEPGHRLPIHRTRQLLFQVRQHYRQYIAAHQGDQLMVAQELQNAIVVFGIAPLARPVGGLTWADGLSVVEAFQVKLSMEGYRDRWAKISLKYGGPLVGTALVGFQPDQIAGQQRHPIKADS